MLQHADDLSLLQAQVEYKKRLDAVMSELTAQENALKIRLQDLKEIMLHAQKEVDRLEGHTLSAFFYNVIGQRDTVLTKERREAYAAQVKYTTALRELEAIQEDIRETTQDLEDLQDCEIRFSQKLEEKRQEMARENDADGSFLLEKGQLIQYLSNQERELEEAITAGTSTLRTMADIQQSLHRAKDWTAHEAIVPAFWTDHARQERIEHVQETVALLQIQLQRFNRELSDVTIRSNLGATIERMLKFADSFFDTLAAELGIPDKVRQSCSLADQTQEHILSILRQLQNALEEVRHDQVRTQQEMDRIVLRAINE
ncbi:MAG: hypothetical protein J6V25_01005 [Oscillospiraceae bacterium]|nr:hypothetical protein [Oscillospiraceae bacterium]